MAALEGPLTASRYELQREWGMAKAMADIGFGAAFGEVLGPVFGRIGEAWNKRHNRLSAWQEMTPEQRLAYAESNEPAQAFQQAMAEKWAIENERSVNEYFKKTTPEERVTALLEDAQAPKADSPRNGAGVPLSRQSRINGHSIDSNHYYTKDDMDKAIAALDFKNMTWRNEIEGIDAILSNEDKKKLVHSKEVTKSSKINGFHASEYRDAVIRLRKIWRYAVDTGIGGKRHDGNEIRRFVAAIDIQGKDAYARLTIKDKKGVVSIYAMELLNEEKLRLKLSYARNANAKSREARSFEDIIKRLNEPVKGRADTGLTHVKKRLFKEDARHLRNPP